MCKMIIERRLRDAQFGFIPDRERGGGCNIRGAATYGETGKACDRVPRQEVWMRNRKKGLPDNYVMIVQDISRSDNPDKNQCTWAVKKSQ